MKGKQLTEVQRILAEMKAGGVTIEVRPAPGIDAGVGDRAAHLIQVEAEKLGMTFGAGVGHE